jgi:broad-specificity NMP kinase
MKLIILNGPPGVGKSTIAARLHQEIPSSVLIDVDELRRTIPNYRERREESLLLSYQRTAEMIEKELRGGHDVIIDKAISYSGTLDTLIETGKKCGAEIYEFLLFADKATVRKRADARGYKPGSLLTPEKVDELWEKANELRMHRPEAIVVDTTHADVDEVFKKVHQSIKRDL